MNALILVNKPTGVSSTKVGTMLKHMFGVKKAGHAGTLDLEASGLLLVLLGSACRLQSHLLAFRKEYSGIIQFGVETDTDDIFGQVLSRQDTSELRDPLFRKNAEISIRNEFCGLINQVAPKVSAKKSDGIPDYKRVRKGEIVIPKSKEVEVEVLDFTFLDEKKAQYRLKVSSGFYIRSFARDAGALIGIKAVAESICRTSIGPFQLPHSIDFSNPNINKDLFYERSTFIKSIDEICDLLPYERSVITDQLHIEQIQNGNRKPLENLKIDSGYHLLYTNSGPLAIVSRVNDKPSYTYVIPPA